MHPSTKPSARYGHEMIFDKKHGVCVLFGGTSGYSYLSDTWVYSYLSNTWIEMSPSNHPPGAEDASFAYDEEYGRCVLFGGKITSNFGFLTATWCYEYRTNTWTNLNPSNSPSGRWSAKMIYIPTIKKIVLFGGDTTGSTATNDTWVYDSAANTWTKITISTPISPRVNYGAATDGELFYCAYGATPYERLSDTWVFDPKNPSWFCLEPPERPSARYEAEMVYIDTEDVFVLFGGRTGTSTLNGETWEYNPKTNTWRNLNPSSAPQARDAFAMAYDSINQKIVLFGGRTSTNSYMSDTWVYDYSTNTWTRVYPTTSPPGRYGHEIVFDKKNGVFVMYGGRDSWGALSDTWVYNYATNTWTQKITTQNPGGLEEPAFAFDEGTGKCILFGGNTGTTLKGETWAYDVVQNTWNNLNPSSSPTPRWLAKMTYLPQLKKLVMFGGGTSTSETTFSNETWVLDAPTNKWTKLNLASFPRSRGANAQATDGKSIYIFAGYAGRNPLVLFNDTWVLNLGTAPSPPRNLVATAGHSKIFLNWETPGSDGGSTITGYKIYRGTSSGNLTYLTTVGTQLNYTDTAVTLGTTYYYAVSAVNAIGESALSNEASATPLAPSVPSVPKNFTVISSFENVTLSWEPPVDDGGTPVIGYRLYRGNTSTNLSLYAELGNQLTYKDTNVSVGKVYYYALSALNNIGEGNRTEVLVVEVYGYGAPSAPRNLVAEIGDRKITLSWVQPASDGGSPITNYRIYRSTVSGTETPFAIIGNYTAYTDTNVTPGVTYYYQVAAINAIGEGNKSNEANATAATTPSQPKNLTGYFDTPGSVVRLAWQPPSDTGGMPVSGYKVYRGLGSGTETYLDTASALAYVDANIQFGKTYYYVVRAYNAVGESTASNEISVLTGYLPSQPRFLTASVQDKNVTLTWVMPLDTGYFPITNYRIYRGIEPTNLSLIGINPNITSYTDMVTTGGTYYYAVSAVNAVGEGAKSEVVSATVIGTPGKVRNLTAEGKAGKIVLNWEAPLSDGGSQITNYKVYRGLSSDNLSLLATLGVQYSYTDTNITSGIEYFYAVSAVNGFGEGLLSDVVSAKAIGVPSKVQYLEAKPGNGTVLLTWYPPLSDGGSPVIKYNIYRGLNESNLTKIAEVSNTNYTDKNLKNGVRYCYAVSAENAAGESERAIVSTTPFTVPGKVLNLRVLSKLLCVTLEWTKPTDDGGSEITAYRIYRWADGENETLLEEVEAGNTTYIDSSVEPGKTYHYRVSAVNAAGEGEKSDEIRVTVESGEAIVNACLLGILLAVIAGVVVVALLVYFLFLRKKKGKPETQKSAHGGNRKY
ncbi:MAG: fibronectin type III domain-containing protein [Thermoplasmata archaeon]